MKLFPKILLPTIMPLFLIIATINHINSYLVEAMTLQEIEKYANIELFSHSNKIMGIYENQNNELDLIAKTPLFLKVTLSEFLLFPEGEQKQYSSPIEALYCNGADGGRNAKIG